MVLRQLYLLAYKNQKHQRHFRDLSLQSLAFLGEQLLLQDLRRAQHHRASSTQYVHEDVQMSLSSMPVKLKNLQMTWWRNISA